MPDLTDYLVPLETGSRVADLTGKTSDGLTAGGYSAFVNSITGEPPAVVQMPNRRASLVLTNRQKIVMQKWLDTQLSSAFAKPKDQTLDIELNPVLVPWALKYVIPTALLFVVIGWVAHWYLSTR